MKSRAFDSNFNCAVRGRAVRDGAAPSARNEPPPAPRPVAPSARAVDETAFNRYSSPAMNHKIRVLVAKPGLDGHDRGAKVVASALRDRGMEVIYTGLHQTPESIVEAAIQEDVDAVGLSILSGAHMTLFPRIAKLLQERGAAHIVLTGGGIIPKEDVESLRAHGFARLFGPGATTDEIADYIEAEVTRRRATANS